MKENLKVFFERLKNEPELREKFALAKTAYEGFVMATSYLENVSFDEFKDGLREIHNKQNYRKQLLNDELTKVSGGTDLFREVLEMLSNWNDD